MEPQLTPRQLRTLALRAAVRQTLMQREGRRPFVNDRTRVVAISFLRLEVTQWLADRSKLA
jgi:hypothetical protein